jgi:hypothetical protein
MSKLISTPNSKTRQSKKIPCTLENLFQQADFISAVGDDEKICFKQGIYIKKGSWYGAFRRETDGESSADLAQKIKLLSNQLFEQYDLCADEEFSKLILLKLVELHNTCIRLRDGTYSGCRKEHIAFTSLITSISVGLPNNVRENQGMAKIGAGLSDITPFSSSIIIT